MATDVEIAWCAGLFDGEGCVRFYRSVPYSNTNRVSPLLMCSVSQNSDNIEVLEEFQRITGLGKLKGPYKTPTAEKHVVSIGVNEVESLCKILAPYLKRKKLSDFQLALFQFWNHDPKPTPEDFARKIRRGKKKGCTECGNEWNGMMCSHCGFME